MGDGQGSKPCGQGVQFLTGSPILKGENMDEVQHKIDILKNLMIAMDICDSTPHEDKDKVIDTIEEVYKFVDKRWEV